LRELAGYHYIRLLNCTVVYSYARSR